MKTFSLVNSVVTHFSSTFAPPNTEETDYEYVLQCKRIPNSTQIITALSNKNIQIYDQNTLHLGSKFAAHSDTVNEVITSNLEPWKVATCSSDASVKVWDLRTNGSVQLLSGNSEVWSMAWNRDEQMIAYGMENAVCFHDIRMGKMVGQYTESFLDSVTKVRFHPTLPFHLVTASEDGLVNLFDCSISNEEDAALSTINAESCVSQIGFFGPKMQGVYCITSTETLDLWNLETAERMGHFPKIREDAADANIAVDYLVDCKYNEKKDTLRLVSGDHSGNICIFKVKSARVKPAYYLQGGHKAAVRCIDWSESALITGGEDSRISKWSKSKDEASIANSTNRPMRADSFKKWRKKSQPY